MDPKLIALLGQAGVSIIGELIASGQEQKARDILQKSLDAYGNISLPNFEKVVAQQLGPSALANVRTDPSLSAAQHSALGAYDDIISGNGLAAEDQAILNRTGNQLARRMSANRSGIQQDMAAKGMQNSGAAVAAQLSNAQATNQNLSEAGFNTQAEALKRRYAAIQGKGQMAGEMRNQDFGEKSKAALAADEIAKYNANARAAAQGANNGNAMSTFGAAMSRQAGMSGAGQAVAGADQKQAGSTRTLFGNLGASAYNAARSAAKPEDEDPYGWKNPYGGY